MIPRILRALLFALKLVFRGTENDRTSRKGGAAAPLNTDKGES